jgi:hypothetical protein
MIYTLEAWRILHTQVPGLFKEGTMICRGELRPGQTIQVGVLRKEVRLTVGFEVFGKGMFSFYDQMVPNMSPRSEVHAHYARIDQRIPPYACCVREEVRPYCDQTRTRFHLKKDEETPDPTGNEGDAAGGDNGRGQTLPPIIYPTAPIDINEEKIAGGLRTMPGPDSCETDSLEDEPGSDDHNMVQIAQAIHKNQPVTVSVRGKFQGNQDKDWEDLFEKILDGLPPTDLMEVSRRAMVEIQGLSVQYVTEGTPGALLWLSVTLNGNIWTSRWLKKGKEFSYTLGL